MEKITEIANKAKNAALSLGFAGLLASCGTTPEMVKKEAPNLNTEQPLTLSLPASPEKIGAVMELALKNGLSVKVCGNTLEFVQENANGTLTREATPAETYNTLAVFNRISKTLDGEVNTSTSSKLDMEWSDVTAIQSGSNLESVNVNLSETAKANLISNYNTEWAPAFKNIDVKGACTPPDVTINK